MNYVEQSTECDAKSAESSFSRTRENQPLAIRATGQIREHRFQMVCQQGAAVYTATE